MKKILLWSIGGTIGVLLLLAGVGLWAKKNDPQGYEQKQQAIATKDSLELAATDREGGYRSEEETLRQTKAVLEKQGLTLCQVYNWIGESEDKIRRSMEAKYGIPAAMKMAKERNDAYDEAWSAYRKQHNLPDSIRMYVNLMGLENCK